MTEWWRHCCEPGCSYCAALDLLDQLLAWIIDSFLVALMNFQKLFCLLFFSCTYRFIDLFREISNWNGQHYPRFPASCRASRYYTLRTRIASPIKSFDSNTVGKQAHQNKNPRGELRVLLFFSLKLTVYDWKSMPDCVHKLFMKA